MIQKPTKITRNCTGAAKVGTAKICTSKCAIAGGSTNWYLQYLKSTCKIALALSGTLEEARHLAELAPHLAKRVSTPRVWKSSLSMIHSPRKIEFQNEQSLYLLQPSWCKSERESGFGSVIQSVES